MILVAILTVHAQTRLDSVDHWMMMAASCRVVYLDTSNCLYFVQHLKAYHLNSKYYRTNYLVHCYMIVSWWLHSRLYFYKYLVLLNVEPCDYWNSCCHWSVAYALCAPVRTMVHFQSVSCCHYCCYCHSLHAKRNSTQLIFSLYLSISLSPSLYLSLSLPQSECDFILCGAHTF